MDISFKRKFLIYIKTYFSKLILFILYRSMKTLYKLDNRIKKEIDLWPKGRTIVLSVSNGGPKLCIKRVSGGLVKKKNIENPDIRITFKSLDGAFLVLSGRIGTAKAYGEHRFAVKGNISEVMSFVRCIDLTEAYLFPKFITKNILQNVPDKQVGSIRVYCGTILGF